MRSQFSKANQKSRETAQVLLLEGDKQQTHKYASFSDVFNQFNIKILNLLAIPTLIPILIRCIVVQKIWFSNKIIWMSIVRHLITGWENDHFARGDQNGRIQKKQ